MVGEPGWVPPGVDTKRANVARVYGYWRRWHRLAGQQESSPSA